MPGFTRPLPCPMFMIPPSIDPLSDKNCPISEAERLETLNRLGIDPERPMLLQVSRFDRFKDPLGVIEAYRMVKPYYPEMQLVLAGGPADDDPEGAEVLREVMDAAGEDKDLKILMLPPDSHRMINALQRSAVIVLQKSLKEGFGLTVTEALWKGKPVIGGAAAELHCKYTITRRASSCIRRPGRLIEFAICYATPTSENAWGEPVLNLCASIFS